MSRHTLLHRAFTHPAAATAWLGLRIYLGLLWIRFGVAKIDAGWLVTRPLGGLLRAVADGGTPALPAVRPLAGLILRLHLDPLLSVAIPLFEVAVGTAFLAGVLLVPAAAAASLLNLNLILFGIASWRFDGRIILLQLLILAGWRVAGRLGLAGLTRRLRSAAVPCRAAGQTSLTPSSRRPQGTP